MKARDKSIRYHEHALQRMKERGIEKSMIEKALRAPDLVRDAKRDDAKRYEKSISKRRKIVVIASQDRDSFWVISAWRT